ncbi:DNA polymerase III, partial [Escherichia coli]
MQTLPPDIHSALYPFLVNAHKKLVYGNSSIKGGGEVPLQAIILPRNRGGYFRELLDLCARTDTKKLNRRVLEKPIMFRGVDRLGPHRPALMNSLGDAVKPADQHAEAEAIGQADMIRVVVEQPEQSEKYHPSCP